MRKYSAILIAFVILMLTGCEYDQMIAESTSQPLSSTKMSITETSESSGFSSVPEAETIEQTSEQTTTHATEESVTETATTEKVTTTTSASDVTSTQSTTALKPDDDESTTEKSTRKTLFEQLKDGFSNGVHRKYPYKAFFDDAVFVGDSVTQGLKNYVMAERNKGNTCLGNAEFLCATSLSYASSLQPISSTSIHPTYKGKKVKVEEGISQIGAKKVFIMLGMNDFSGYKESVWQKNIKSLTSRILEMNPHADIYIESVTPIVAGKEHDAFTNKNVQEFNAFLKQFCKDNDFTYVDIYNNVMVDNTNHLNPDYCGDSKLMGIHMNYKGAAAWTKYLTKTFCGE